MGEQPEETEEPSSPFKPKDPTPEPELTPPPASWAARVSKGTTFPSAAVQIPPAAVVQQPPRQLVSCAIVPTDCPIAYSITPSLA